MNEHGEVERRGKKTPTRAARSCTGRWIKRSQALVSNRTAPDWPRGFFFYLVQTDFTVLSCAQQIRHQTETFAELSVIILDIKKEYYYSYLNKETGFGKKKILLTGFSKYEKQRN